MGRDAKDRQTPARQSELGQGDQGYGTEKAFRDAFTETDTEAAPAIAKHLKDAVLDVEALFPGQGLPEPAPDQLKALLGLNPAGKGKYVEYETSNLKDFENIPLKEDILSYMLREVRPYVADAWIDRDTLDEQDGDIGKVGHEINILPVPAAARPSRDRHRAGGDGEADYEALAGGDEVKMASREDVKT